MADDTTAHQQALDRFKLAVEAEQPQRDREKTDLELQVPEKHWNADIIRQRKAQVIEGVPLPARPMISVPMLDQPVQLVLNQEKSSHLGVTVHALNEEADEDTAEVLTGLYRSIEVTSRANLARSWAFERAVKVGRGAYRILTEMDPTAPRGTDDQRIVIKRLLHQDSAYFDPFAQEPDWSDGEWGFIASWVSLKKYRRLYPDSRMSEFETGELNSLAGEQPLWITGEGEARAILVVEYFEVGAGPKDTMTPNDLVLWRKLNAIEVLDTKPWNGIYVPIVPTIGRELIPIENQRYWTGIYGPNRGAQEIVNYSASAAIEMASLETKASHELDPLTIEGFESWWNQKNVRNFPYLPRRRFIDGIDYGPASPIQADMSKVQMNLALLSMARDFIHTGTGAFEPTLGDNSPNVRTKGATLALQNQHEQGNSNWLDNLSEISMTYEAKVVLDMIPRVYDRPGRVARVLDLEDHAKSVMLNAPFVRDRATQKPMAPPMAMPGQPAPETEHFDLSRGRYGVTVSIGKAYKSRVDEGKNELAQLFQAEPQLFQILGDIYLKFADFPGHREAAERVKKMLPPPLQEHDESADPTQQLAQMKGLLAQAQQQIQALAPEKVKADVQIQTTQTKASADLQRAQLDAQSAMELERMKIESEERMTALKVKADLDKTLATIQAEEAAAAIAADNARAIEMLKLSAATERDATARAHAAEEADKDRAVAALPKKVKKVTTSRDKTGALTMNIAEETS